MKKNWVCVLGVFFLLSGLVLGLAPTTVLAQAPGPLDHVVVIPSSVTLAPGGTQQFVAQGYDANNVAIPGLTYYWGATAQAGTITATGLFTAGNVPNFYPNAVQAVALHGSIAKVGYVSVTITGTAAGPLDHVAITPASVTLAVGGTKQFTAQGYDANNMAIPGLTYFWSVVAAGAGTITQTGLFTAGNTPSSYPNAVQVIAVQGSIVKYATASVTVTATPQQAAAIEAGPKRLLLLVAASLRGIGFEDFLGAQWTVKEDGTTSVIKAIPGVVKAISANSLTLLPNGQAQNMTFAFTPETVILAKDGLKVDEKAAVVTVNDHTRLVVEVPLLRVFQAPPGLRKHLDKLFDKLEDRFLPPGWDKGKKTGWGQDDDDN